jgi:predicted DNA-binding transcriptional regulator YafY
VEAAVALNKGQKMVKMVELMTRRGGVSSEELESRFELDGRTLRRYLADLKGLGLPLEDSGRGLDRVISIDPRWRRTGVRFTLAEVLSLHFGRKLFNFLEGTSFADDLSGAIERLEPAISKAHQDLAQDLDRKFLAVPEHTKDYRGDASEVIDEVITALVYNNVVDADYRKPNGVAGRYILHPYTLATFRQGLYLFALDVQANRVKTFAVERFVDLERRRGEYFDPPNGWKPEAHIADAFGIISGPTEDIILAFSEQVATYIRERTWHPTQIFRRMGDGRLELLMRCANTVELRSWILGFGGDVEVLEPQQLRKDISGGHREALAQYKDED